MPREICFTAKYYRAFANVESILALNHAKHIQGIASAARTLFEVAVDVALVDKVRQGPEKMVALIDVEKMRSARAIIDFKASNPAAQVDATTFQEFIRLEGPRITSLRDSLWRGRPDVQHWSLLKMQKRVERLGPPFDELYAVEYPRLSWYIHFGLTGFANLQEESFELMAGIAFNIAVKSYMAMMTAIIAEFKLDKKLPEDQDADGICANGIMDRRRRAGSSAQEGAWARMRFPCRSVRESCSSYPERKIKPSDGTDIEVLSAYLPCMDVVCTDAFMAEQMRSLHVAEEYNVSVFHGRTSGLRDLATFMESYLAGTAPVRRPSITAFVLPPKSGRERSFQFFLQLGAAQRAMGINEYGEIYAFNDGAMPSHELRQLPGRPVPFWGLQGVTPIEPVATGLGNRTWFVNKELMRHARPF